jgi:hypothetical protein
LDDARGSLAPLGVVGVVGGSLDRMRRELRLLT